MRGSAFPLYCGLLHCFCLTHQLVVQMALVHFCHADIVLYLCCAKDWSSYDNPVFLGTALS